MNTAGIILREIEGSVKGMEYVLREPGLYLIGRTEDCDIQLPGLGNADVSRRHCIIELTPLHLRLRDLGSLNGTFVNGMKIGQRSRFDTPDPVNPDAPLAKDLRDGDEIKVGQTVFRVAFACADQQQSGELLHAAASEGNAQQ